MTHNQDAVSRRRFVQVTAASSLALAGIGLGRSGFAQAVKPNIVFILADDLGYADVGCYGQRDYTTPNIDRLEIEGLKLLQAYSNSANCTPTRVGLATGRYQMRLEVGLEEPINPTTPKGVGLPPSHPTLRRCLRRPATAPRWSANGIWAICRSSVRSRAATIISSGSSPGGGLLQSRQQISGAAV